MMFREDTNHGGGHTNYKRSDTNHGSYIGKIIVLKSPNLYHH